MKEYTPEMIVFIFFVCLAIFIVKTIREHRDSTISAERIRQSLEDEEDRFLHRAEREWLAKRDSLEMAASESAAPGQECEKEDMYLQQVDRSGRVKWISIETDAEGNAVAERVPEEVETTCDRDESFTVAGKSYTDFRHFLQSEEGAWGRDVYDREVLCVKERFPCFDSADFLYESRYYRWYYIRKGNSLSEVYAADDSNKIMVTEDVLFVNGTSWSAMQKNGFCQRPRDTEPSGSKG